MLVMQKVTNIFLTKPKTFSFELFPPKTPEGHEKLLHTISQLCNLKPDFISCTYGAGGTNVGKNLEVLDKIQKDGKAVPVTHFTCIGGTKDDIRAKVAEHTHGRNADLAFDCAAHPSVHATILDILRVQGTSVVVGSYKKPPEVDLLKVEFKELTLIGTRVYTRRDFETAIAILQSGRIDFERLLTVAAPEEAPDQFGQLLGGKTDAIKLIFQLG